MSCLKWHGGKHYLATRLIKLMPPHIHYVEPYFGGGAVLFRKEYDGISEVINDLNGDLINFWQILADDIYFEFFRRKCEATPFCELVFNEIKEVDQLMLTPVGRAWCFFIRYRQSRQGLGKDFATITRNRTRRGMNEQVSSWLSAVEGLPEVHERLKRVLILNRDALDVIKSQDGPNTLFYLDPPYLQETRIAIKAYGQYEMGVDDHINLLNIIGGIKGKFLLSGYHSPLYDSWASDNGFECLEIEIPNHSSGSKVKRTMTECVWKNFYDT